ncbi:hypothetical protein sos41_11770 [Alphaproteobacteria bacterium SO-S41]|nr:hypothetical protein sos41_11770 [Alphaproteobacteria bacterium SO-S41]
MEGLRTGASVVRAAVIEGLQVSAQRGVAAWAEAERYVSADSGSPHAGKWSNDLLPYLVEIMDCLDDRHPASEVTVVGGSQCGKTSVVENFIGYGIVDDPAPLLIVLPTLDEAKKFNRIRLAPMIEATPTLKAKVRDQISRDESGSTASFKKFRGGFIQIAGANASAGLQSISVKRVVADELTEFPEDVDGRGDPWAMAQARSSAWDNQGAKHLKVSTPGIKGVCRITKSYEDSDQRRLYWPCPGCGVFFTPRFAHLRFKEVEPYGAELVCPAHGCVIPHHAKRSMLRPATWLKCYPGEEAPGDFVEPSDLPHYRARGTGGRQPGFFFWQVISPMRSWDVVVKKYIDSKGNYLLEKVFSQQVLAEAFEEKGEAPDEEKLYLVSRNGHPLGRIPPGGYILTGGVDVQGDRLEWAVWAWGPGLSSWLIDKGVIPGDPEAEETWRQLDAVMERTYAMPNGREWGADLWGVDTGFKSHAVYAYSRGRSRVLGTDGRDGHLLPLIGTGKKVDVNWKGKRIKGGAMLWPLGTYPLKSLLYSGLRKTLAGPDADGIWPPGTVHLSADIDQEYCRQLTAEFLADVATRDGRVKKQWRKKRDVANEALDIWGIARAMACQLGLDRCTPEKWQTIAINRGTPPDVIQGDLLARLDRVDTTTATPAATPAPAQKPATVAPRRQHRSSFM